MHLVFRPVIEVFTDPMMGLSYEHEPVLDRLRDMYGEEPEIRYVMAGLVRDVSDFMNEEELSTEPAEGIRTYCRRLALIYKSEEQIGGLLINMEGFHLFDEERRSSYPLCIASKAAQLADREKADRFLYALRSACIIETKQVTREDEILRIAENAGIDPERFTEVYRNGKAEKAFMQDLYYVHSLGIRALPAYPVKHMGRSYLMQGLPSAESFMKVIGKL